MANLFWVGGSASYDGVTNVFATTTGGVASVAAVTSADNVFFDAGSGAVTATMGAGFTCNVLDFSTFTGTFDLNAKTVQMGTASATTSYLKLVNTMTFLNTGGGTFICVIQGGSTFPLTTGGQTMPSMSLTGNGTTGTIQLQDTFTGGLLQFNSGIFDSSSQSITCSTFSSTNTNSRTVKFGSSQIKITGGGASWATQSSNNQINFAANTATVTMSGSVGPTFRCDSTNFNGMSLVIDGGASGAGTFGSDSVTAIPTFQNLTVNAGTNANVSQTCFMGFSPIVSGTLTLIGNPNNQVPLWVVPWITGNVGTIGTIKTITVQGSFGTIRNVDFTDITVTGTAGALTGTRIGDALGNSGIVFDPSVTQTWQGTSGGSWNDVTKWTSRIPLPQDDVIISSAFSASQVINGNMRRIGRNIDWTGSTGSPRWNASNQIDLHGNVTFAAGMLTSTSNAMSLNGRGNQTVTSNGVIQNFQIRFAGFGGTTTLVDDWTGNGAAPFVIAAGTVDTNNKNIMASSVTTATPNVGSKVLLGRNSTFTVSGTGTIWNPGGAGIFVSSSKIVIADGSATSKLFIGSGNMFGTVIANGRGSDVLTISGSNTYTNLDLESTLYKTILFPSNSTQKVTGTFTALGNSTANGLQLISDTSGIPVTLTLVSGTAPAVNQFVGLSDVNLNARWWVGGAGTWDQSTTHWAVIPGSSSGATAPSSTTHAYFDGTTAGFGTVGQPVPIVTTGATAAAGGWTISGTTNTALEFQLTSNGFNAGTYNFIGNPTIPILIRSNTTGSLRTPTVNGTWGVNQYVHFMDFAFTGTAGTLTGTQIGDAGGNGSGITFEPSVTQTWQGTSGGSWNDVTKWSTRIPLPQDDVIVSSAFTAAQTITANMARLGRSIDFTGSTGNPTFQYSTLNHSSIYGSLNLTGLNAISTGGGITHLILAGRSNYTLTSHGVSIPGGAGNDIQMNAPTGTYTLQDNWSTGCQPSINFGTLDTNNFNVSAFGFTCNATATGGAGLKMNSSTFRLGGSGNIWNVNNLALISPGTSTIIFTDTTVNGKTFTGNGQTFNSFYYTSSGTGSLTIQGFNTFRNLDVEAYSKRSLFLTAGSTQKITGTLTLLGANTPSGLNVQSTSAGSAATLTLVSGTPALNPYVGLTSDINLNARWWVGGNGTWDSSTTTHWSVVPGSGGGASAPGGSTHAYFDPNSGVDFINNAVSLASSARAGGWTISGTTTPFRVVVNNPTLTSGTYNFIGGLTTPIKFESSNFGSQASFTFNGATYGVIQNVMISDLAIGGNSGTLSGTRMGDCGGNSNITFEISSPQTWQGGTGSWSDPTKWTSRVPLPQDDVFIAGNGNINVDMRFVGRTIDFTGSVGTTANAQLSTDGVGNTENYGSFVLVQGGNWQNSNGTHSFNGRGTHTITSAGNVTNSTMQIRTFGSGSYTLADPLNINTGRSLTVNAGTFNSNDQSILCRGFGVTNSVTTVINLGRSIITCAGTTGVTMGGSLAVTTYNVRNATFLLTDATTNAKTFAGGGVTFGTVRQLVGSGTLTFTGNNTFDVLDLESSGGLSRTVIFPAGGTQTINRALAVYAASGTNLNLASSIPGTAANITMISGSNPLFMNQSFSPDININYPKMRYWVGGAGNWDNATTTNWATTSSGAGGASAPDVNTTVVFDYNSGLNSTQSVSIGANATCLGCAISGISVHPFALGKANKFLFTGNRTFGSVTSSGSFSFLGRDQATPLQLTSSTTGIGRQLTLNGVHGLHKWANFADLMILGTAGTLSGTLLGDMQGNSGQIAFEQSVPQAWKFAAGGNYSNPNNWTTRVPLPQDDVTIAQNLTGQTINLDVMTMGRTLDMSNATGNPTMNRAFNSNCWIFGDVITPNTVTWGGANQETIVFGGRGNQIWNPGNSGWGFTFQLAAPSGTYLLQRSVNVSQVSGGFNLTAGTLDTGGWPFGCKGDLAVSSASTQVPAILVARGGSVTAGGNSINNGLQVNNSSGNFVAGSGTWTMVGTGTVFTVQALAAPNMYLTEATILITDTSATTKTFAGAGGRYGTLQKLAAGTGSLTITGNNTFKNLDIEGPNALLTLTANSVQTVSGTLTLSGTAGTALSVVSATPGTKAQIVVSDGGSYYLNNYSRSADIFINPSPRTGYFFPGVI